MRNHIRIVTVTYNSQSVIEAFLDSIPTGAEVVVVDNASSDRTRTILHKRGVKTVLLDRNYGFGTACNRGAEGNDKPFVFFVNPDAVVDAACCANLCEAAARHPETGAFNPAILNSGGGIRLNCRSSLVARRNWTDKVMARDLQASVPVHMLSGAALFCRQKAFAEVNGFDERIFLYHEDDDLCVRLEQAGWALRLEHGARVSHLGGASSGGSLRGTYLKAFHMAQSRLYVERKHNLVLPGLRAFGRLSIKLLSPFNLLSRRKRTQTRGFWHGTLGYDAMNYGAVPKL